MDLHLPLDPRQPLVAQICRQLREAIADGRLARGDRVPPSRYLAQRLLVSRRTVSDAYEQLVAEGLLRGRAGSGTFVSSLAAMPPGAPSAAARSPLLSPRAAWANSRPRAMDNLGRGARYDFSGGTLNLRHFPFAAWRASLQWALRQQARQQGLPIELAGHAPLREAIARYLAVNRAVRCNAADLLVTHGAQQALNLIAMVMLGPGSRVAMEEPGYTPARQCFVAAGAEVIGVPVDAEGLRVDCLPEDVRLVYVTPSHQFPLGMPLSQRRCLALLEWARRRRVLIVEDDYDGEYRFDGRPLDSLQGLDRDGLVAYLGTFSKTLFPELRLGYLSMPPGLRDALLAAKQLLDRHSCALQQYALADFMERGEFARHTLRMQRLYGDLRTRLLARLDSDLAQWLEPIVPLAGIHLAALLKPGIDPQRLAAALRERDICLGDMDYFYQGPPRPGLLIGFGSIEPALLDEGLGRLAEALAASGMPAAPA